MPILTDVMRDYKLGLHIPLEKDNQFPKLHKYSSGVSKSKQMTVINQSELVHLWISPKRFKEGYNFKCMNTGTQAL